MPSIGETLREARLRQGLDIADVEERTKIRAKYLRALENEEWGLLPGHTFVKTFLRTYAEQVGVDPHLLVEEYRTSHEADDEPEFQPLASRPVRSRDLRRDRRGPSPRGRMLLPLAALAAAVVVFLLALGLLGGGGDGGGSDRAGDTATERTTTQPRPAKRPARPRRRARPAPRGVALAIRPAAPTYACLDKGAGTPVLFEGTLDAARTFRDRKLLRVNLGKRGVDLRVNGRRVRIPPSGDPVGYEVTRRGAREIATGTRPCA